METFKTIPGFQNYSASNLGRIRSRKTGTFLSPMNGRIRLFLEGVCYQRSHPRLIADMFVPNPESKKYIRFADGNKYNVSADNIYWSNSIKYQEPENYKRNISVISDAFTADIKITHPDLEVCDYVKSQFQAFVESVFMAIQEN